MQQKATEHEVKRWRAAHPARRPTRRGNVRSRLKRGQEKKCPESCQQEVLQGTFQKPQVEGLLVERSEVTDAEQHMRWRVVGGAVWHFAVKSHRFGHG